MVRFGFPYFLFFGRLLDCQSRAASVTNEYSITVIVSALAGCFGEAALQKKSKVICHEKVCEILTRKIAVHRTRHARGAGRRHATNSSLVLHAAAFGHGWLVEGRRHGGGCGGRQQWRAGERGLHQRRGWPGVCL